MDKKETTRSIENAGRKVQKGRVKHPEDKGGSKQEIVKIVEEVKQEDKELTEKTSSTSSQSKETETPKKIEIKKIEKPKKYEASVRATGAPISTRHSVALCNFIKRKKIEKAIEGLEEVFAKRKALPMKGEFAHKKGMMSGKYPQNSTQYFIKLLKSLQANANANDIKDPVITEAIANLAPRPRGRFGRYKRKRTHISITAKEIKNKKIRPSVAELEEK
ncbi:MAG: uL22 family ribosomal protein [archaeon]